MFLLYCQEIFIRLCFSVLAGISSFYILEQYQEIVVYLVLKNCFEFFNNIFSETPIIFQTVSDIEIILYKISFFISFGIFFYFCNLHIILFLIPSVSISQVFFIFKIYFYIVGSFLMYFFLVNKFGFFIFLEIFRLDFLENFTFLCQFSIVEYFVIIQVFIELYLVLCIIGVMLYLNKFRIKKIKIIR